MKKLLQDFRDFISRGNVLDLAIGIIIGSAFSTVVNSVVENILMPPLGLLLGNADFQDLFLILRQGEQSLPLGATLQMAREAGAVTFNYGQFLTDLIGFLILGFSVFLVIKGIQTMEKKTLEDKSKEEEESAPVEKDCPFCLRAIPLNATRCPYCTSQL